MKTKLALVALTSALLFTAASHSQGVASTTRHVDAVEWPADRGSGAPIPEGSFSSVNLTFLPVLVPAQFFRFKTLDYVGAPLFYTASISSYRAKVSITGTRVSFSTPENGLRESSDSSPEYSYSEKSVFGSFRRFGVAYLVTVECASLGDSQCTRSEYVAQLIKDVELVGGAQGEPDASLLIAGAGAPLPPGPPADPSFSFRPPGELVAGSGAGVTDATIAVPGIRFPVENRRAYLNSQVYGIGGSHGASGGWSDLRNFAYPWRDNFCETRPKYKTPRCPGGRGHQGVDIRPERPKNETYWAVATEAGKISSVGSYSVVLMGESGTQYRYLHLKMKKLAVKQGDRVERGQRIGLISNDFGGTPTPVHLHFEILQGRGKGVVHVPPYSSLVNAYQSPE